MTKLASGMKLKGASGAIYSFDVYSADTNWAEGVTCVYYVSRRTEKPGGGGDHSAIYVGETDDIKERFSNHHKQDCFEEKRYNAISIHRQSNAQTRRQIESDLIRALDLPCND